MTDAKPRLIDEIVPIDDYMRLREISGLTPFPRAAAEAGLANAILGVSVVAGGQVVGMGRVIGDGGLFFQIVDIAVEPAFQGRGLGKAIMRRLIDRLAARLPAQAYVSLMADGEAHRLYSRFGFQPVQPRSIGMFRLLGPRDGAVHPAS
jgi:ribosomal protein S18 acetylase RimI-like enzyme